MLKEMSFYLLRDKQLVLPNSQGVEISEEIRGDLYSYRPGYQRA